MIGTDAQVKVDFLNILRVAAQIVAAVGQKRSQASLLETVYVMIHSKTGCTLTFKQNGVLV